MTDIPSVKPLTGVRWTICALVFIAMTVNYMDRQIFSLLVPFFEDDLKLGPTDLALINVSFILPYGLCMIFVGRYIDRVGIGKGLASTYLLWNLASVAHALVRSLPGFMGVRLLLGLGEAGMYPSAVKTATDWFPVRERSLANGYFNAGANCGAILAPLLGVWIATQFGWRACFVVTGAMGMIWLGFWKRLYAPPADHPKISESELAYIHSDPSEAPQPFGYRELFALPSVYGLAIAKALSDAPWWFYLTWMPKFLTDQFHVGKLFMAFAIPVVYIVADVGSVAGGWMSSRLIQKGVEVGRARKMAMLVCALAVVPVMSVGGLVDSPALLGVPAVFWAVGITAIAAGAHQGFSSNLFTLITDTTPRSGIAMAVGAINGFAMVGASAMQFFVGRTVQLTSSYTLPFIVAGSLYLVALLVIQVFLPHVRRVTPKRLARIPLVLAGVVAVLACLAVLQYETNRPPYASLTEYQRIRGIELHATAAPEAGPAAQVGWMTAKWFLWRLPAGKTKLELIKLDTRDQPFVEAKGAKAARYRGPSEPQVITTMRSN